jgi:hypothetical protein
VSGWIKLEKDRRDDPRVLRMARELRHAGVTHERFTQNAHVTLVLGCLDVLWCYADTHVREDDTLDLGSDEVDELVGLEGFCGLMPSDWLEVINAQSVKLPDFHKHNGTESKKKALSQKRQERHRNGLALQELTQTSRTSVTEALLDQDQTKTIPEEKEEEGSHAARDRVSTRQIDGVFLHWKTVHQHPQAKDDAKRRKLIAARLRDFTYEQLRDAISGYKLSPFHMGKNDESKVYDSIELMLRDAKQVEQGLEFLANPPKEVTRGTHQQNGKPRLSAIERVYQATAHLVGDSGRVGLEVDGGAVRAVVPDGVRR